MRLMIFFILLFLTYYSAPDDKKVMKFALSDGKVTANFSHAPLRDVAALVANQAHIVVRISPSLIGEINISLDQVPVNQALNIIFKSYGGDLVYADKADRQVREVVLLNEGENVSLAEVFVPHGGYVSLLSQAIQKEKRKHAQVAKTVTPSHRVIAQRKTVLAQELGKLQQQKRLLLEKNQGVSVLNARLEVLQREMSGMERNLQFSPQSAIYNRQQIEWQRRSL